MRRIVLTLIGLFAGFAVYAQTASKDEREKERAALMALYEMTDGDHWINNENWGSDKPVGEWYGVYTVNGVVTELSLSGNNLKGNLPDALGDLSHLKWLEEVTMSKMWSSAFKTLEQNEGHSLVVKGIYESVDFSKDGDVKVLQKHSKGKGIPLVLTGTAYTDRLIADRTFQKVMDKAYESYFSIEPLTSFKDYFDVYQLTTVSKNEYIGGTDIAFGTDYDLCLDHFTPIDSITNRLLKIAELQDRIDDISVIMVAHDLNYQGVYTNSRFEGKAFNVTHLADRGLDNNVGGFENRIHHEACGHGLGKLADEYFTLSENLYPESEHPNLDKEHEAGWSYNLDYHDTPETVLWKDFLTNPDYDVEDLGLYEGGFVGYDRGIFRPSDDSVMNNTANQADYFNAPSRWAIYMHIMQLAGEPYAFEDFLEYDKKNIGKQGEESTISSAIGTESNKEIWYNLQGQRITAPQRHGLYIKNGKKIVY